MESQKIYPGRWSSDQHFGTCITAHDFCPFYDMRSRHCRSSQWHNQSTNEKFSSTVENEAGYYKITLDVKHFHPNEISVKVADNDIIVEGKHDERADVHGFVTRQFKRRYPLPSRYLTENITSTLSSDGILTIIAERILSNEIEKIIPIKLCGAYPQKTQMKYETTSARLEDTQKEYYKASENLTTRNSSQKISNEDDSLLKPENHKSSEFVDVSTEKRANKQSFNNTIEKSDPYNINSTSSKIEKSLGKSILGLTALSQQLGQSMQISGSENHGTSAEVCDKPGKERELSELCAMKEAKKKHCVKGMTKTVIQESSSSRKSSSLTSKSLRSSAGTKEDVTDLLGAELREAAENV